MTGIVFSVCWLRTPHTKRHQAAVPHLLLSLSVLVVAAPPLVGRALRPPLGRVLPGLLAAEGRQVEEGPHAAEPLHPAPGREVGAEHAVTVAQEHAEAEHLAVLVLLRLGLFAPEAKVVAEI